MLLIHGNTQKVRLCECPACRTQFKPLDRIFFPRESWHPFRTYDFHSGYQCENCGFLMTKQEVEKYGK